jgi:hypothetical protein
MYHIDTGSVNNVTNGTPRETRSGLDTPDGQTSPAALQSTDTTLRCILLAIAEAIIDSQVEAFLTDPLQGSGEGLTSAKSTAFVSVAVNGRVHAVNAPSVV